MPMGIGQGNVSYNMVLHIEFRSNFGTIVDLTARLYPSLSLHFKVLTTFNVRNAVFRTNSDKSVF